MYTLCNSFARVPALAIECSTNLLPTGSAQWPDSTIYQFVTELRTVIEVSAAIKIKLLQPVGLTPQCQVVACVDFLGTNGWISDHLVAANLAKKMPQA